MGHAVFVFGAAGAGKTTFCKKFKEEAPYNTHISLINLDPAQESCEGYDVNLCDHITVDEVMENYDFGPNGALFFALQEMIENIDELKLEEFESEYIVFDCPGQIELFLHSSIMNDCLRHVQRLFKVAIVYLTDSTSLCTSEKFLYSSLCATLCMYRFCVPAINIATKMDLIDEETADAIVNGELPAGQGGEYGQAADEAGEGKDEYRKLKNAIGEFIDSYGIVNYIPLNWEDEDMVKGVYLHIDSILQRFDDIEIKEKAN